MNGLGNCQFEVKIFLHNLLLRKRLRCIRAELPRSFLISLQDIKQHFHEKVSIIVCFLFGIRQCKKYNSIELCRPK